MITPRELVPDRMLRQEGLAASLSAVGYPDAFETWNLVRSGSKEPVGFLSFHSATADDVVIKFCRFLPGSAGASSRCYSLDVSKRGTGVRSLLRRALRSQDDPYLEPRVVDPAPEIYRDAPNA
ncbi:MAG: hypothetical protein HZA93_07135 [Verrucomicrobia bacterium]|nr:hypothetical protein [Verrucomicrobiota bacterium]